MWLYFTAGKTINGLTMAVPSIAIPYQPKKTEHGIEFVLKFSNVSPVLAAVSLYSYVIAVSVLAR